MSRSVTCPASIPQRKGTDVSAESPTAATGCSSRDLATAVFPGSQAVLYWTLNLFTSTACPSQLDFRSYSSTCQHCYLEGKESWRMVASWRNEGENRTDTFRYNGGNDGFLPPEWISLRVLSVYKRRVRSSVFTVRTNCDSALLQTWNCHGLILVLTSWFTLLSKLWFLKHNGGLFLK